MEKTFITARPLILALRAEFLAVLQAVPHLQLRAG
jgi:hypothetical protein